MSIDLSVTRELGMFEFHQLAATECGGTRHWLARAQNLYVEWVEAVRADAVFEFAGDEETMVLVFGAPIEYPFNRGILSDDIGDLLDEAGRLCKRRVLTRLRLAEDKAGILLREKALGDFHIEDTGHRHQDRKSTRLNSSHH